MESLAMHLVIAQEYYKKHPNLKYSEFLRGTLQPDLEQDKNKSHYSRSPKNNNDIEEMLNSKVDIDYCSSMDLELEHQKIAKGNVEIDFNLSKGFIRKTKKNIKKSNKQEDSL